MRSTFKEIRIFCGNEYVGHNSCYIEFVYKDSLLQDIFNKLSGDLRIRKSRSKTGEYVFDPVHRVFADARDFIKALKRTQPEKRLEAIVYDEMCLLAQDYTNKRSGTNYRKDDECTMPIEEVIEKASLLYFRENEKDDMEKFKKQCMDIVLDRNEVEIDEREL